MMMSEMSRQQRAQQDHRPRHAVEANARGHEGVGLGIGRHLAEAQQQPEEQCGGKRGAQIMRHQIGQHLEHHGEGVLLAECRVEQAHHAVGQQHEQADHQRARQRQRDLPQDMPVKDAEHRPQAPGRRKLCHRRQSSPAGAQDESANSVDCPTWRVTGSKLRMVTSSAIFRPGAGCGRGSRPPAGDACSRSARPRARPAHAPCRSAS